jgi:DNA replication protein DnaC
MVTPPGKQGAESEECPICHGRGWVILDVPLGHPDFGKAFPCQCTLRKFEQEKYSRLERYSGLGPLTRLTFDNLRPQGRSDKPENQQWFSHCYQVAKAFAQEPKGWLLLIGPSGCGKTHMAAAIANQCLKQGLPTFFIVVPDFLDHLRTTFSPDSDVAYDELFEQARATHLLVLDDLGAHSSTAWAEEKLFQILNHRFNAQLPTVVTTIDLEQLNERLRTRLSDLDLVQKLELEKPESRYFQKLIGLYDSELVSKTFDNFDVLGMNADKRQQESLRAALKAARRFAESPADWLVFEGPTGCGKTHLAAAIANHQLNARRPVFFTTVPDLLNEIRATLAQENVVLRGVSSHPLLILDDLGTESKTPWAREKLFQILNYRYNARLPTVITSRSLEELESQLSSRITDVRLSNVIHIDAPDYRGRVPRRPRRER